MRETAVLFARRFQPQILDIHDEFSARGLQDPDLDDLSPNLQDIYGNVDMVIKQISHSIHRLVMLCPPDDLYKGVADERLSQMALDEAQQCQSNVQHIFDTWATDPENKGQAVIFYQDFKEQRLDQIEYLRAELLRRIGAGGTSAEESLEFNELVRVFTEPHADTVAASGSAVNMVSVYIPEFTKLAQKLKDRNTK